MHHRDSRPQRLHLALATTLIALATLFGSLAGAARAQSAIVTDDSRSWEYDLSLDVVVRQDQQLARFVQGARLRFELDRPAGDRGVAVVTGKFDTLNVLQNTQGRQVEFNWRSGQDGASSNDAFKAICQSLANATLRLHIGSDGSVLRVDGLSDTLDALAADNEFDDRVLGIFGPDQIIDALAPIFTGDGVAHVAREKGDGWQSAMTTPLGPAGEIEFVTDWSITERAGESLSIKGVESFQHNRPATPDPAAPSMAATEHAGETDTVWNFDRSILVSRLSQRTMAAEWSLGDFAIQQRQSSTYRINLAPGQ